ncbi:MAG: glycosyl transferase family 2 [Porticoccaceae bacterium]|nr:glycosyl transferase family 2 [Porticoccaceae bacterium]|tara:strand:- start:511 stop:1458 length:948 start_codon:yes stop_codon:yes gene_type:complete
MKPDVSIVIVSYNTRDLTVACIDSIIKETKKFSYEIIVLDNNSTDGSAEAIKEKFENVTLFDRNENLGFAGGNNEAARHATSKRLLILNPDTIILNGAIDNLLQYADKNPDARLWGGRAIFEDGSTNASCWMDMTLWSTVCRAFGLTWMFPKSKLFNPESIHIWGDLRNERAVDIVVGCFLMLDRDLWVKLDGFNPLFYMYGDEVDLCIRARKLGAAPRITPDAEIIHYGGGSEPSSEDKLVKVFKGRITVMNEHWSWIAAKTGSLIMISAVALRALASKFMKPPERKGAGQDGATHIWSKVLRRREEWASGWSR